MANRHQRTLAAIFAEPVPAGIAWRDIEALLVHLGAEIREGRGSRIRVTLHGRVAVFHRPHPEPTTDRGAVRAVRDFLREAGFGP